MVWSLAQTSLGLQAVPEAQNGMESNQFESAKQAQDGMERSSNQFESASGSKQAQDGMECKFEPATH